MRSVILSTLIATVSFFVSCTSIDCSVNSTVALQCQFRNADNVAVKISDYLTVTAKRNDGTDTVLVNHEQNASFLSLPMSYTGDCDELAFTITDAEDHVLADDIVKVSKTNDPVFESVDCTPRYNHQITDAIATNDFIDRIVVNHKSVSNDATKVHLYIYVRSEE